MTLLAAVNFPPGGPSPDPSVPSAKADSALRCVRNVFSFALGSPPTMRQTEVEQMDEVENLLRQAAEMGIAGKAARQDGEETKAEECYRRALDLARDAASLAQGSGSSASREDALHLSVRYALDGGEAKEARRLMAMAGRNRSSSAAAEEWDQFHDESAWPDSWLVAAVRRNPPDEKALDVLADRYWKPLFGRCQVLALNHHRASDLAQEAWCRVLRTRHTLKPGGNFPAFLTTIATNLWRDWHRSSRRAGLMAEHQLASLDAVLDSSEGNVTSLADILPDLNGLEAEQKKSLLMDIDRALERLSPQMRDVLVSAISPMNRVPKLDDGTGGPNNPLVAGFVRP